MSVLFLSHFIQNAIYEICRIEYINTYHTHLKIRKLDAYGRSSNYQFDAFIHSIDIYCIKVKT